MPDRPVFSTPEFHEAGEVCFRASRRPGAVFSTALRFAASEARPLALAVLAIAGPMAALGAVVRGAGLVSQPEALATLVDLAGSVLLTSVVFAFVWLYQTAAPRDVAAVWEETTRLVGPVFWMTAFGALLLSVIAIPFVMAVVGAFHLGGMGAAAVAAVAALVALVVAIPVFTLATVAAALDGLDVSAALARAVGYVRGEWRLAVGTTLLVGLVAALVLRVAVGGLAESLGSDAPGAGGAVAGALVWVATMPVSVVFALVWVVLYGSLVARSADWSPAGGSADEAAP